MSEQVKPASEQKPVAWLNPVNGSVISDSHRIYLLENYPRNKCEHIAPLYTAPQPDYKAQRDAERYRWLREGGMTLSWRDSTDGKAEFPCCRGGDLDAAIDAAIASVKGTTP